TIADGIVGYAQISWWKEADGTWVYLHNEWVLPEHRSPEVLTRFLAEIERHIAALSERQGRATSAVFGANASDTEQYRSNLLQTHGYQEVWAQIDMELTDLASLQAPSLPEGITISPLH